MDGTEFLPKHILDLSIKPNNEIGWSREAIPEVLKYAHQRKVAVLALQVQMNFPKATCDFYWLCYQNEPKEFSGTWEEYCNKTFEDSCKWLETVTDDLLEHELRTGFGIVAERQLILKHARILTYFIDKENFEKSRK